MEKTPDTSDFTSQPVKEESERAAKPPLPAAACKFEILPFTFGQMQGSCRGVCVCVWLGARLGPSTLKFPHRMNSFGCLILQSHIFFYSQSKTSVILASIQRNSGNVYFVVNPRKHINFFVVLDEVQTLFA